MWIHKVTCHLFLCLPELRSHVILIFIWLLSVAVEPGEQSSTEDNNTAFYYTCLLSRDVVHVSNVPSVFFQVRQIVYENKMFVPSHKGEGS